MIRWLMLAILIGSTWNIQADEVNPGVWDLYSGTSILVNDLFTEADCIEAALQQVPGRYGCRTITEIIVSETIPEPPPPEPAGNLLYQDLVRGPVGSPVTGWCQEGQETIIVGESDTLCGEPLTFEVTNGLIINAYPPLIPSALDGDLIVLNPGDYTQTGNCGGWTVVWCGNGHSGVSILGKPGAVVKGQIDCGTQDAERLTFAGIEFEGAGFNCHRVRTHNDIRLVNNYVHDNPGHYYSFGEFTNGNNLKILGNRTLNTGEAGLNQSQNIYYGGGGTITDVEIAYNVLENHNGGSHIQVYGHWAGESLSGLKIHHNTVSGCNGREDCILISHTDGQGGTADERAWINDAEVYDNVCLDGRIKFRGANLGGGDDWLAYDNHCPIDSSMGGTDWVIVTNNDGTVTGNVR